MKLPMQWFWVLGAVDGRMGLDHLLALLLGLGRDPRAAAGQAGELKPE